MSFQIKLTDPSLRQDSAPVDPKKNSSFTNNLFGTFYSAEQKTSYTVPTKVSRPSDGSDKGLAIRQVPLAQADHM